MIPKMSACVPKLSGMGGCWCGRRGLPSEAVDAMYQDYLRLGSLEKAGALHDRTRQSMFEIFKRRGLKLNEKKFLPSRMHQGKKYTAQRTSGRHRYLRSTIRTKGELYLHHEIWIAAHGPIPQGHKVCFKDGNHLNCELANLELLSNSEQVRKYAATGNNGATVVARARLANLLNPQSTTGLLATLRK